MEDPEQACPSTNLTPCETMRLAMATACFGSQASSWTGILMVLPFTPPFLLMAAAASSAPCLSCSPMVATEPVIGPATAMVMSSERAIPVPIRRARTDRQHGDLAFMVIFPSVGHGSHNPKRPQTVHSEPIKLDGRHPAGGGIRRGHCQLNAFSCPIRCFGPERATHFQELRPVAE